MSVSVPISMPKSDKLYLEQLWIDSPFLYNRMIEFIDAFIKEKLLESSSYIVDAQTVLNTGVLRPEIDNDPENAGFRVLFWSFEDGMYIPMGQMSDVDLKFLFHFMHYISRSN